MHCNALTVVQQDAQQCLKELGCGTTKCTLILILLLICYYNKTSVTCMILWFGSKAFLPALLTPSYLDVGYRWCLYTVV